MNAALLSKQFYISDQDMISRQTPFLVPAISRCSMLQRNSNIIKPSISREKLLLVRVSLLKTVSTPQYSSANEPVEDKTPFYKKIFRGKTQDAIDHQKEIEEKIEDEEKILREIEMEEREAKLKRKQNRSKLHHSHRNILKGEPPQVGLSMNWDESHMTRAYKAQLLGQFGRSRTGIDPSICWPTPDEIAEDLERERVLYDNKGLPQLLEEDRRQQEEEAEAIRQR